MNDFRGLIRSLTRGAIRGLGIAVVLGLFAVPGYGQLSLSLFNGTSLQGWTPHGLWTATGGSLTTVGAGPRSVETAVPFADLRLDFEYNETGPIGAKLRLWTSHDGNGGLSIDLDQSGNPAGVGGIEQLSHSSLGSLAPGWHRVQVDASNGFVSIRIDGQPLGSTSGLGSRGGYIGFEASGSGGLQVRNLKLTPLNLTTLFNGTDLSGWKSVARGPDSKGGVGHTMEKTLTFGIGGGSTKAHEAKWTVRGGAIHGEAGPGGLENATNVQDGIFQVAASIKGEAKQDSYTALAVRGNSGQLGGGYEVGIGPYAGGIDRIVTHPPLRSSGTVDETIVVAGRTIVIWVNGALTTVHTDTRAEAGNTAQGAKTGAGTVALMLPRNGEQLDVQRVNLQSLPKTYGVAARAPAPPPPPPVQAPVAPVTTAAAAGPSEAEKALLAQQQASAKKDATDQANKQRVASLMNQALATTDPQQQIADYQQVVQIDPSNAAAVQGIKEAQAKIQAQQTAQQQAAASQLNEQQQAASRDQQTQTSLDKAQSAFLSGRLTEASAALSVAERLSPGNPLARDLRTRISSAQAVRSRLSLLGSGMGVLALAGVLAAWFRRRRQQRYPVLEITRGVEEGRMFPVEKDLLRIGAVAQNGTQKNDIVIQDIEHAISRFHCEVSRKNGQLYVTDLKSSNGTRLNGQPLQPGQPELLRQGSTITLANNVDLRFGFDRRAKKSS